MCCSSPPAAPDLTASAEASTEVARINQQTAREQLEWARSQDTSNRELLQQVLDIQLPAMREQYELASADRQRYEQQFRPIEDKWVEEAMNYDTPERRAQERARSLADVNTQFDAQRRNALSRLEGYGVDPSTTRSGALDIGMRTQQAAAAAGAATQSDRRVEDVGRALQSDVINLGRGALSNAQGFYGQAVNAGSQAQGNALNTTQSGAGAVQSSLGFSGQALQGYGQGANIMSQGFGNQMQSWNAGQQQTAGMLQGLGGFAGLALGGFADGGEVPAENVGVPGKPYTGDGEVMGPGDGSGIDDRVPAMLSEGEYVIPADVVRIKGEEFFDKILEKYHTPAAIQERDA
jgi:hypothetical protein